MKLPVQCFLSEPYPELLERACGMKNEAVQDVRLTCQLQSLDGPLLSTAANVSRSEEDVSSVLSSISDWQSGPQLHAASLVEHLPDMVIPSLDALTALSAADLLSHQTQDPAVSTVLYFVERKCRPSRREPCHGSRETALFEALGQTNSSGWHPLSGLKGPSE